MIGQENIIVYLGPLAPKTPGQGKVLRLNGNTFSMDGSQICVFEQRDKISLCGLLKGHDGRGLEPQVGLEVLGDFTDKALEGELPDKELGRFLVTSDFTESDGSWAESVWFLYTTGSGLCCLPCCLGRKLFARRFTSGGFPGSLLGASHRYLRTCCEFRLCLDDV